jgi:hypothetical protein
MGVETMKLDPDQKEPFGDGVEFIKNHLMKRYGIDMKSAGKRAGLLVKKFMAAGQLNLMPDEWEYILDKEFKPCYDIGRFVMFVEAFNVIDPDGTKRRTLAQEARKHVGGVAAQVDGVMAKAELTRMKKEMEKRK